MAMSKAETNTDALNVFTLALQDNALSLFSRPLPFPAWRDSGSLEATEFARDDFDFGLIL